MFELQLLIAYTDCLTMGGLSGVNSNWHSMRSRSFHEDSKMHSGTSDNRQLAPPALQSYVWAVLQQEPAGLARDRRLRDITASYLADEPGQVPARCLALLDAARAC